MSGITRSINKWIEDNGNGKTYPQQTLQYCRLLQHDYPYLSIVSGAIFFDKDELGKKKVPGKHQWCVDGDGKIYDVSKNWFDKIHSYKQLKIIRSGEL